MDSFHKLLGAEIHLPGYTGEWSDMKICNGGFFYIQGFRVKAQASLGTSGDDNAMTGAQTIILFDGCRT